MTQSTPSVLSMSQLNTFHKQAAQPFPTLIIGMGRWGRVWASVMASCRGTRAGLAVVARSNFNDTRKWLSSHPLLKDTMVFQDRVSGLDWLHAQEQEGAVWITSRPRDHEADLLAAHNIAHVALVEKPLTQNPGHSLDILNRLEAKGSVIMLGIEYALHPVFHRIAEYLIDEQNTLLAIELIWIDSFGESRHGAEKRTHDEITILTDLWPHFFSIARIFTPLEEIEVQRIDMGAPSTTLAFDLICDGFVSFSVNASKLGSERQRLLRLTLVDREILEVDFSNISTLCHHDGRPLNLGSDFEYMDSTLRLVLGAVATRLTPARAVQQCSLETDLALLCKHERLLSFGV